jgi:hypothetical protein
MSSWYVVIMVSIAVLFMAAVAIAERYRLRRYFARPCAGIRWHRRFPNASHHDIRVFLKMFVDAFSVPEKFRSMLRPDETVIDIYNARYIPHLVLDDNMEFETLVTAMQDDYGIDLQQHLREDITLADIFELTRSV